MGHTNNLSFVLEKYVQTLAPFYSVSEIHTIFSMIAERIFGCSPIQIIEKRMRRDPVNEKAQKLFAQYLHSLEKGMPIQYVLGETDFYGHTFKLSPAVLIPRPETEELVEWILQDYGCPDDAKILDIGTGSGVIAITLALNTQAHVDAVDISEKALQMAQKNAQQLGANVRFIQDDFLQFLPSKYAQSYQLIVSNPPYIREEDYVDENVFQYEPKEALFALNDPLQFYHKTIEFAHNHLTKDGSIYVEINQWLAPETLALFQSHFHLAELKKDISGNQRMIKATRLRN